jgi:hypothetical protein
MVASMIVRLFGLAVIAGVVVAAMVLWRRAMRNPLFLPAAKRKTGPVGRVRVICGVLGGLIVLGSVYYTLATVRASYAPMHVPANMTVRMPTTSVETEDLPGGTAIPGVRLLATMLIMDVRAVEPRPVHVEQFEIHWPAQSQQMERPFRLGGMEWQYNLAISRVWLDRDAGAGPQVRVSGTQWIDWRGSFGTLAGPGAMPVNLVADAGAERITYGRLGGQIRPLEAPLSVTPATPSYCYSLLLISRVSPDDSLPMVPIERFVEADRKRITGAGIFASPMTVVMNDLWRVPAGGVRLAVYLLGVPVLLLIAAAALLAQVFRRRDLAFAGLVLGLVLYVAAFDRAVLAYDLSRLADPQETLQARLVACSRAGATFFYQGTALQGLYQAAASAPGAPSILSDRIRSTVERLTQELRL